MIEQIIEEEVVRLLEVQVTEAAEDLNAVVEDLREEAEDLTAEVEEALEVVIAETSHRAEVGLKLRTGHLLAEDPFFDNILN